MPVPDRKPQKSLLMRKICADFSAEDCEKVPERPSARSEIYATSFKHFDGECDIMNVIGEALQLLLHTAHISSAG
jgi:hypothetical protein